MHLKYHLDICEDCGVYSALPWEMLLLFFNLRVILLVNLCVCGWMKIIPLLVFTRWRHMRDNFVYAPSQCIAVSHWLGACTVWSLHWRHKYHGGVSNHQPHGRLLNRLFRRKSKKTSKLRVTGLCVGNSPVPVNSPHKGPVTRKIFPLDDVIMIPACGIMDLGHHCGR